MPAPKPPPHFETLRLTKDNIPSLSRGRARFDLSGPRFLCLRIPKARRRAVQSRARGAGHIYTRISKPDHRRARRRLAALEGASAPSARQSGMGRDELRSATLLNAGDQNYVAIILRSYGGTIGAAPSI